jgi:hypothetical protein
VGVSSRDEARVGGAEHKLIQLAVLSSYHQPPAVVLYDDDRAGLRTAAEVLDASRRPDAREWS